MDLYIKQRVFSFNDQFTVMDKEGNECYQVQGKMFSFADQLTITEVNGSNQALIKQKLASWMPRYTVEVDGEVIFEVVKKFTFFKASFAISPSNWTVEGDAFNHRYVLKDGERELMNVTKEWLTWGDTYHITIDDEAVVLPCLAIMIILDMVLHNNKDQGSSAISFN